MKVVAIIAKENTQWHLSASLHTHTHTQDQIGKLQTKQ